MSHDHVGVPKFLQKGFSQNNVVYVSNLKNGKVYPSTIDRLGTENDYFDEDVEKEILADGIETKFGIFCHNFCNVDDYDEKKKILDSNKEIIEQFFSFMFFRSKIIVNIINEYSIISKILGDINHSETLRIENELKMNVFKIVGNDYILLPVINLTKKLFINNSVGFGLLLNKVHEFSVFIPLNTRNGILITANVDFKNEKYIVIGQNKEEQVEIFNRRIVTTEKELGNGFFFGLNKETICKYNKLYK